LVSHLEQLVASFSDFDAIETCPCRDLVEPSADSRISTETVYLCHHRGKYVLENILGIGAVSQDRIRSPKHGWTVPNVQVFELLPRPRPHILCAFDDQLDVSGKKSSVWQQRITIERLC
jgi:hypothetical protein